LSQEVFDVQDNAAVQIAHQAINDRLVYNDNYLNVTFGQTKPWVADKKLSDGIQYQLLSCTNKFFIDIVSETQINSSTYATRTLSIDASFDQILQTQLRIFDRNEFNDQQSIYSVSPRIRHFQNQPQLVNANKESSEDFP
ncbi:unnamed protein product, partial [Rotaria sp. Silwood1]